MINTKRSTQEILQDEMLRERAAVLARAGERLAEALEKLQVLECDIESAMAACPVGVESGKPCPHGGFQTDGHAAGNIGIGERTDRIRFISELNGKIRTYNLQREHVRKRYYYLIVTREALGMIHHQRLEEIYRIPPKKRFLSERWQFPGKTEAGEGAST
ncbi:MAG: hypothetical protein PHP66_04805 [Syntrophales bacterium]|nr:hypothetical protein [Syntrophales bacterium]